ncbi:hypothetical protein [Streptomonospora litoralis]|uniref:Uncharacterized protein n=1 Tax=Streptomonospora litoralis TaxID=2498135 RepID=A0A4V0ZJ10_9ACTN|nr:hypothetical protein [Streptomonospora litoralis]QBI51852.1 hypothetical protein EKD16_00125 [Streptomonospora litoralis]
MTGPEVLFSVLFVYSFAVLLHVLRSAQERGVEIPDVLLAFDAENTAEARRAAVHQDDLRRRIALVRDCEERAYGGEVRAEEPAEGERAAIVDHEEGGRLLAELRAGLADLDAERDRRIEEVERDAADTLSRRRATLAADIPYDRALRTAAWVCLGWLVLLALLSTVL